MVFLRTHIPVSDAEQIGYAFALPRLLARLAGRKVRSAQFSAVEAWSLGLLVFGLHGIFVARLTLFTLIRRDALFFFLLALFPFALWILFLLLYYAIALLLKLCRRLGFWRELPNYRFQHFVISGLTTVIALLFLGENSVWLRSLGGFWFGLFALNLAATVLEKSRDET